MPRTNSDAVRKELDDVDTTDLSNAQLDQQIEHASTVIDNRVAPHTDADLTHVETALSAHYAYKYITGAATGDEVEAIMQDSAEIRFATSSSASGESASKAKSIYYQKAVDLDPTGRLDSDPTATPVFTT